MRQPVSIFSENEKAKIQRYIADYSDGCRKDKKAVRSAARTFLMKKLSSLASLRDIVAFYKYYSAPDFRLLREHMDQGRCYLFFRAVVPCKHQTNTITALNKAIINKIQVKLQEDLIYQKESDRLGRVQLAACHEGSANAIRQVERALRDLKELYAEKQQSDLSSHHKSIDAAIDILETLGAKGSVEKYEGERKSIYRHYACSMQ